MFNAHIIICSGCIDKTSTASIKGITEVFEKAAAGIISLPQQLAMHDYTFDDMEDFKNRINRDDKALKVSCSIIYFGELSMVN